MHRQPKRKISFSSANWTSKTLTIEIDYRNHFKLYGYDFRIEFLDHRDGAGNLTFQEMKVYRDDTHDKRPIFTGNRFPGEETWTAWAYNGDVRREHEDPFVAAGQIIANIF